MESILAHKVKQAPNILWLRSAHVDFHFVSVPAMSDDNAIWKGGDN